MRIAIVLCSRFPRASTRIRGVLSLTQLERQLGKAIGWTEIASSFANIERVISDRY